MSETDENIRAEHTFFERARIDKTRADKRRESPDIGKMFGAKISEPMTVGGEKISYYYWATKKRRTEMLPKIVSRYVNPTVTLL